MKLRISWRAVGKSMAVFCGAVALVLAGGWTVDSTSRTSFCLSCHEMTATGQELAASGHGRNRSGHQVGCAECHITPGLGGLLRAKWLGLGEVVTHLAHSSSLTGQQWEDRRMALRRKLVREMPQENCTSCHDLAKMKPSTREAEVAHQTVTPAMRCLDCHSVEGLDYLVHNPADEKQ